MHILQFCIKLLYKQKNRYSHLIEIFRLLLDLPRERGRGQGEVLQGDVVQVVPGVGSLVLPLVTLMCFKFSISQKVLIFSLSLMLVLANHQGL